MSRTYRNKNNRIVREMDKRIELAKKYDDPDWVEFLEKVKFSLTTDKVARKTRARDPGCHPTGYHGWIDVGKSYGKRETTRKFRRYNKNIIRKNLKDYEEE